MKNTAIIFFFGGVILLLTCNKNRSQESNKQIENKLIDSSYISNKSYYFTIDKNQILGNGKQILYNIFKKSQFVILGELHNSKQTSKLVNAIVPLMSENQFSVAAFEVGPNTAEILKRLSTPPEKTVEKLKEFNTNYYHKEIQRELIPFFFGIEDGEFLKSMASHQFQFWGFDQEYFYSIFYFTDEIEKILMLEEKNSKEIEKLKLGVDKLVEKWMLLRQKLKKEGKGDQLFIRIAEDPIFINYVEEVRNTQTSKAITILEDLEISWDIYSKWRKGSHQDRISYMRNNFMQNFCKNDSSKIFVKTGQLHASQVISNSTYDLGHFLEELARSKKLICTNINSMVRYHNYTDKEVDNINSDNSRIKREKLLLQFGKKEQWTIIDLESIREDFNKGLIKLPQDGSYHRLRKIIEGYDYQLILPLDEGITPNLDN